MEIFRDREVAIKFGTAVKARMLDEATIKKYNEVAVPSEENSSQLLPEISKIHRGIYMKTYREVGGNLLKLFLEGPDKLIFRILQWHRDDKEVMQAYNFILVGGVNPSVSSVPPLVGDPIKDVDLVNMETGTTTTIAELHLNKERPLAVIASSLS
ncbi:uncharacterized protein [Ptychodera flava]|uniref:uncharacterized protein n=1 Tax=Ptychodera flava TaxID=63121 RepID=UPI003969E5C0